MPAYYGDTGQKITPKGSINQLNFHKIFFENEGKAINFLQKDSTRGFVKSDISRSSFVIGSYEKCILAISLNLSKFIRRQTVPKFAKLAGLKDVNVPALRKTFGSLLIQSGQADLYTVSKLLCHSSIKTTERYYVDLLDENYHKSVRILDTILTSTNSNLVVVRKNASN